MTRSTKVRLITAVVLTLGMLAPLLGPAVTPASAVADVQTERIGGADRFETAANVARAGHPGSGTAVIANGLNFPDALAGSTLAGALNAPILLVAPRSIPAATSSALNDLGVNDIVIVGGPAAVSTDVENQLRQNYGVTRVFGDDRYKTSVEIARRAAVGGVGTVDGVRTAFVSTGLNFPDALGAGPLAYEGDLPSFLTRTNELPPEVAQAIRDLNVEHVVILGGTQAVSGTVEAQLETIGVTTERLNGRNRAETATFVADFALARMGFEGANVILARGDNFPDALAGGPLGGERRAVVLLTATPCQLAIETRDWLEEHFGTVSRITALGGQNAVCDAVLREAEQAAETNNIPPDQVELTISGGSMNGGPQWQYQDSNASPSQSLTLTAFVSSDPSEGTDPEAQRAPAAREDVVFNIRPSEGDDAGNTELNLTARTGTNGIATVTYTRGNPGTDIITVRLTDDTTVTDDGVGRWNTETMPLSLSPDESQSLAVDQPREFTVCDPGPEGDPVSIGGQVVNLTTLELLDDDPNNDTNVPALRFSSEVADDRGDTDETVGKVTTEEPNGCVTFTVSSNAAQIFTLMAFLDDVDEPAAHDDNTDPSEYRDIAGTTTFGGTQPGLNITPANDNNTAASSTITRRNGQQIVYTVTAVDPQGQPLNGPIDVSFRQIVDGNAVTTTTAEFDWVDNSEDPSNQEGLENEVPPGATATSAGTTRVEVIPNSNGKFTFAITHPKENENSTSGHPVAWIDLTGGTNNRPDDGEPQADGENFTFNAGTLNTASLESLGCPPGTDQRGTGNNPFTEPDPCLGRDVMAEDPNRPGTEPHVPWSLDAAPTSPSANAATSDADDQPNPATISRGDVVFRFTYRDVLGEPTGGTIVGDPVVFEIDVAGGIANVAGRTIEIAPNRPNAGSETSTTVVSNSATPIDGVIEMPLTNSVAEIVVDASSAGAVTVRARFESGTVFSCIAGESSEAGFCQKSVTYITSHGAGAVDTTKETDAEIGVDERASQCPSPTQQCFNGNLVMIDKARDSYIMNTGSISGRQAYVVYAVGGGGELYTAATADTAATGERPGGTDEYFIDGLLATPDTALDNDRCGHFSNSAQAGCARFDAAMGFDDRMVYEFAGTPPTRTQTHFLTNGTAPTS